MIVKHGLRNALIPIVTVAAIDIGAIVGGLIITERIFEYPGMGDYFLTALGNGDFPQLMPWMVIIVIVRDPVQPAGRRRRTPGSIRGSALTDVSLIATGGRRPIRWRPSADWPRASPSSPLSPARLAVRRFMRHQAAMLAHVVLAIITRWSSSWRPWIAPYGETQLVGDPRTETIIYLPPQSAVWFGTDDIGRDLYSPHPLRRAQCRCSSASPWRCRAGSSARWSARSPASAAASSTTS